MKAIVKAIGGRVIAGLLVTVPLMSCTSGVADIEPHIVSGTVVSVEMNAEAARTYVLIHQQGPSGALTQINVVGSAQGGRDALFREVTAAIRNGRFTLGARVSFVTTGVEIRTGALQYYATHWLR